MLIKLEKFGTTLTSRDMGEEALAAFSPKLNSVKEGEEIIIDFSGVNTFSPSWGDAFLRPLLEKFGEHLILKEVKNPSVRATIEILEETNNMKFNWGN